MKLKTIPCRSCGAPIGFIETADKHRFTPVDPVPVIRHGAEPPPEGKYYTDAGEMFEASVVPCKVPVYRSHWSDCPGADGHRRKK